jgi:hypothetical protein
VSKSDEQAIEKILAYYRAHIPISCTAYELDTALKINQSSRLAKLMVENGQLKIDAGRKGKNGGDSYYPTDRTYYEWDAQDRTDAT